MQGTALGVFGLGLLGHRPPSSAARSRRCMFGWQNVFRGVGVALLRAWAIVFGPAGAR